MASLIKVKRSSTSGNPAVLGAGELAYSNLTDNGSNGGDRLYVGTGTETAGNAVNHVVIGGKYFTDMLDHTPGVLTASSALVVDADKKLDELRIAGLVLANNEIVSNASIKLTAPNNIELGGSATIVSGVYAGSQINLADYSVNLTQNRGGTINLKVGDAGSVTSTLTLNTDGSLVVPGTIKTLSNANITLNPNGTGKVSISNLYTLPTTVGAASYVLTSDGSGATSWQSTQVASGTGDVVGAASSINNTIVRFDSVSGKSIKGSSLSINDTGGLVFADASIQTTAFTGTKAGVGLGNVDNTSDASKPVSTATQSALDLKAPLASPAFTGTVTGITKAMVGLSNVDNESKATMFTAPAFTGVTSVSGSIIPTANITYDLGSSTNRFKDLWLSGSTIDLGGAAISGSATGISLPALNDTPVGNLTPSTGAFTTLTTSGSSTVGTDLTVTGTLFSNDITSTNISIAGNAVITGNLTVQGTTTTINSTTIAVGDLNIVVAKDAADATSANGAGLTVNGAAATLTYTSTDDRWNFNKSLNVATVYGALVGNASTATAWATARDLSLTGDATATLLAVNGAAAVSAAVTLATVNTNTGSFGSGTSVPSFTVNAKGLITAASTTAIPTATTAVLGLASFDTTEFNVTAGAVSLKMIDGGTY